MAKKKRILILVLIIVVTVLLVPFRYGIDDGGSYGYRSVLYDITFWHQMPSYPNARTAGFSVHIFPFLPWLDFYFEDEEESQERVAATDTFGSQTAYPSQPEVSKETPFQTDDGDKSNNSVGNTTLPQNDERDGEPSIGIYISDNGMSWVRLDEGSRFEFNLNSAMSYVPSGIYSVADGKLTLKASNEVDEYIFIIQNNGLALELESTYIEGILEQGLFYVFSDESDY